MDLKSKCKCWSNKVLGITDWRRSSWHWHRYIFLKLDSKSTSYKRSINSASLKLWASLDQNKPLRVKIEDKGKEHFQSIQSIKNYIYNVERNYQIPIRKGQQT